MTAKHQTTAQRHLRTRRWSRRCLHACCAAGPCAAAGPPPGPPLPLPPSPLPPARTLPTAAPASRRGRRRQDRRGRPPPPPRRGRRPPPPGATGATLTWRARPRPWAATSPSSAPCQHAPTTPAGRVALPAPCCMATPMSAPHSDLTATGATICSASHEQSPRELGCTHVYPPPDRLAPPPSRPLQPPGPRCCRPAPPGASTLPHSARHSPTCIPRACASCIATRAPDLAFLSHLPGQPHARFTAVVGGCNSDTVEAWCERLAVGPLQSHGAENSAAAVVPLITLLLRMAVQQLRRSSTECHHG